MRPQRPQRPRPVSPPPFPESKQLEKEWWLRCVLVLVSPRAVFSALRDDRDASAEARSEQMIAVMFLAGISIFFASRTAGRLYDDPAFDPILIVVEAIFAGAIAGLQNYWLGGLAVHIGLRAAGADNRYRQARHLVGLAQVPLVIPLLVVFPVRLALYGSALFRSGGADEGTAAHVFDGINLFFVAWAVLLLVVGTRAVWRWSWARTLASLSLGFAVFAGLALVIAQI